MHRVDLKFIIGQVVSLPFFSLPIRSFLILLFFPEKNRYVSKKKRRKNSKTVSTIHLSLDSQTRRALRQDSKDIIEVEAMSSTRAHGSCRGIFVGKAGSSSSFCRYSARCARQGKAPVEGRNERRDDEERKKKGEGGKRVFKIVPRDEPARLSLPTNGAHILISTRSPSYYWLEINRPFRG